MALRNTPLEQAVIDFMLMYADVARGEQCYTFGTQRYACLDGWSGEGGKLRATPQGLQVSLTEKSVALCAPQPYLYGGTSSIDIELFGATDYDIEIKLEVDGCLLECEQKIQKQTVSETSIYRLITKSALPSELTCLILRISVLNAAKQLQIHRVIFKR